LQLQEQDQASAMHHAAVPRCAQPYAVDLASTPHIPWTSPLFQLQKPSIGHPLLSIPDPCLPPPRPLNTPFPPKSLQVSAPPTHLEVAPVPAAEALPQQCRALLLLLLCEGCRVLRRRRKLIRNVLLRQALWVTTGHRSTGRRTQRQRTQQQVQADTVMQARLWTRHNGQAIGNVLLRQALRGMQGLKHYMRE
jgi:hypothetical protein